MNNAGDARSRARARGPHYPPGSEPDEVEEGQAEEEGKEEEEKKVKFYKPLTSEEAPSSPFA